MNLSKLFFYSLLLTTSAAAGDSPEAASRSSPSNTFTVDQVVQAMLDNNPRLKAAAEKWHALRERIPQANAWDDLKLGAEQRLARFVDVPPNAFTDERITAEQVIPISGKNRSRGRIAAAEAQQGFEQLRRERINAAVETKSAFYRLSNAYAQLALNEKNVTSLKQISEVVATRYAVGNQTAAEALAAQTETSRSIESRRDLERALSDARTRLNVLMNRDAFAPLGIPAATRSDSDADLSPSRLRALLIVNRPEIRSAKAKIAAEQGKLELARRAWIPDPAIGVRAERYNAANESVSELGGGVSFNVPWINAGKYSAATREARASLRAAENEKDREEKEAIGLLRDQLQKIETARHHAELFQTEILPQARQAFEASQLGYETSKTGFAEWIGAQRSLRDVEAAAREHLTDYQIAVAELEGVIGADFADREERLGHKGKSK
jgi:cobalt-zinc-cadmium efflux system outer membrane protein